MFMNICVFNIFRIKYAKSENIFNDKEARCIENFQGTCTNISLIIPIVQAECHKIFKG